MNLENARILAYDDRGSVRTMVREGRGASFRDDNGYSHSELEVSLDKRLTNLRVLEEMPADENEQSFIKMLDGTDVFRFYLNGEDCLGWLSKHIGKDGETSENVVGWVMCSPTAQYNMVRYETIRDFARNRRMVFPLR